VRKFELEPGMTVPHMGWNQLELRQPGLKLWAGLPQDPWMYFVHSFYVDPIESAVQSAVITHGTQTVTASIARDNLMAVQFHPEKSSDAGMQMLGNFVRSAG
jgi:imidazole glycerol-phosphate synthase subunit HisH